MEKEVIERCFPGYIFVETSDVKKLFKQLYFTPGFQKLLGREADTDNFVPLDKDESRMVDILYSKNNNRVTEISNIEVKEGEMVYKGDGITEGPLYPKDIFRLKGVDGVRLSPDGFHRLAYIYMVEK